MQEQIEIKDFVQEDDFIFDELDIAKLKTRMNTYSKAVNHTVFKPAKLKTIKEKKEKENVHTLSSGMKFVIR